MKKDKPLCYQIELLYNKFSPFVVSVVLFIYHILRFFFQVDLMWVQYLCMPSICTVFHMYNTRQAFKLCKTHKCFVNYSLGNLLLCSVEHYWVNPYRNVEWFAFIIIGSLIAFIIGLYYFNLEHEKLSNILVKTYY